MKDGIIIKKYNSYYYVQGETSVIECKLRGRFKKNRYSLCVGDKVQYTSLGDETGIIENIFPRQSVLLRPLIANVQQVIITFAAKNPDFNSSLLDRVLVLAEYSELDIIICLTKIDLLNRAEIETLVQEYQKIGYTVIKVSNVSHEGVEKLTSLLNNKISVFAGPSGAGKSTLLNRINPKLNLKTGMVSDKIGRGKHTTRFSELLSLPEHGFVVDTPGFSLTEFNDLDERAISECFPEFNKVEGSCKFNSCLHLHEPQCKIKNAVDHAAISENRYQSYVEIMDEIKKTKRGF